MYYAPASDNRAAAEAATSDERVTRAEAWLRQLPADTVPTTRLGHVITSKSPQLNAIQIELQRLS